MDAKSLICLDTDICSFLMRESSVEVRKRLLEHPWRSVCVSSIVVGELRYGLTRNPVKRLEAAFDLLMSGLTVLAFDAAAAREWGALRTRLARVGQPIGPYDCMIAAHALHHDATLVTHNTREFSRVPGLRIDDWTLTTPLQ